MGESEDVMSHVRGELWVAVHLVVSLSPRFNITDFA